MPDALVAPVEGPGVACEETPHAPGERARPRADQQVSVVGKEGPGVHGEGPLLGQLREAVNEVGPAGVIAEDDPWLQPAHHNVVQGACRRFRTECGRASPGEAGGAWQKQLSSRKVMKVATPPSWEA